MSSVTCGENKSFNFATKRRSMTQRHTFSCLYDTGLCKIPSPHSRTTDLMLSAKSTCDTCKSVFRPFHRGGNYHTRSSGSREKKMLPHCVFQSLSQQWSVNCSEPLSLFTLLHRHVIECPPPSLQPSCLLQMSKKTARKTSPCWKLYERLWFKLYVTFEMNSWSPANVQTCNWSAKFLHCQALN